jgi:hypothetical protein
VALSEPEVSTIRVVGFLDHFLKVAVVVRRCLAWAMGVGRSVVGFLPRDAYPRG